VTFILIGRTLIFFLKIVNDHTLNGKVLASFFPECRCPRQAAWAPHGARREPLLAGGGKVVRVAC
jgi:hypothetical protein